MKINLSEKAIKKLLEMVLDYGIPKNGVDVEGTPVEEKNHEHNCRDCKIEATLIELRDTLIKLL